MDVCEIFVNLSFLVKDLKLQVKHPIYISLNYAKNPKAQKNDMYIAENLTMEFRPERLLDLYTT